MNLIPPTIGRNDPCHCGELKLDGTPVKFKNCCFHNKKAPNGILRLAFEAGANDPFMSRMLWQIFKIRDHIYKDSERKDFDRRHGAVFQNLYEAKIAKEKCVELIKNHKANVRAGKTSTYSETEGVIKINEAVQFELNMLFKDFFIRGNIALKCLVTLTRFMGFNMSFAFTDDDKFEKKKAKFLEKNRDQKFIDYCAVLEEDRKTWYKIFIQIRNDIEHEGFKLPDINYLLGKNNEIKTFYPTINYQSLEEILDKCWLNIFYLCEEMTVFLMDTKITDPFFIREVPEDQRNPEQPFKYVVNVKGFPPSNISL